MTSTMDQSILVDDQTPGNQPTSVIQQIMDALTNLVMPSNVELITLLRTPTPLKISKLFAISASGNIGGSVAAPNFDQTVFTAPLSAEAWLNRITITSPEHGPASPIVSPAELVLVGSSAGEIILSLPEIASTYQVAPTQFVEGRLSAPHLSPGESIAVNGDGLPANNHIRIDLQITLVQGVSEYTPRTMSPTNLQVAKGGTATLA